MALGDSVQEALAKLGLTADQLSDWLGQDCCCDERREKLNQLDNWTRRVIQGKIEQAREFLKRIISS